MMGKISKSHGRPHPQDNWVRPLDCRCNMGLVLERQPLGSGASERRADDGAASPCDMWLQGAGRVLHIRVTTNTQRLEKYLERDVVVTSCVVVIWVAKVWGAPRAPDAIHGDGKNHAWPCDTPQTSINQESGHMIQCRKTRRQQPSTRTSK